MESSINQTVLKILDAIKKLIIILRQENKALKLNKLENIKHLYVEKQKLLAVLNTFDSEVNDPSAQSSINSKILEDLILQNKILQQELSLNEALIEIKLNINIKFLTDIKGRINSQYKNQIGYNKQGDLLSDKKLEHIMPSISINNKI